MTEKLLKSLKYAPLDSPFIDLSNKTSSALNKESVPFDGETGLSLAESASRQKVKVSPRELKLNQSTSMVFLGWNKSFNVF
jgi:hypothetical protein